MSMIIAAMPAHNEDERIAKVVLGAKKHVDKVVVVDDGSTDATVEIAEALGALVVRHEENRGYGAALRTCFETARELDADMMVILDSDGQHDPAYIPEFIKTLRTEGADVVIGSRFLTRNEIRPKWRIVGMKVLNLFTRLHGVETTDSQSGYRAYSRRAIEKIRITNPDMGASSEILIQAKNHNLKIVEIPITVRYDIENTSSKNPWRHGFGVLGWLIRVTSEKRPLLFFGVAGAVFTIIGLIFGANVLRIANAGRGIAVGSALMSVLFIVIGVFSMFTGLILNAIRKGEEKNKRNG